MKAVVQGGRGILALGKCSFASKTDKSPFLPLVKRNVFRKALCRRSALQSKILPNHSYCLGIVFSAWASRMDAPFAAAILLPGFVTADIGM